MTYHLSDEQEKYFYDTLEELCKQSRLLESHRYMQHGDTSVFRHSVSVAYFSYYLALKMNAPVDIHSLVRGALLHDYFLYDWHEKDASHKWHDEIHAISMRSSSVGRTTGSPVIAARISRKRNGLP